MRLGSRELATRLARAADPARVDRWAGPIVLVALAAYAVLALYLTRGVSFTGDELSYFGDSTGWGPGSILHPHNGHAIAVTRVIYEGSLSLFGTSYLPIKLSMIAGVVLTGWLLYVFLARRIGRAAAIAPVVVLAFAGANPVLVQGNVMMFAQASAAGIGALLLLDRRDRIGDAFAALLLLVAAFSIEVGVGFGVGVGLWLVWERDWRRLWVPAVPLIAYAAWFAWSRQFGQESGELANVLLTPSYAADSMAAAVGSYLGFGIELVGGGISTPALGWGRILATLVAIALVARALRVRPGPAVLVPIGILLVLWVGGALVYGPQRSPVEPRYLVAVMIALLLLAGELHRGWRPTRAALLALLLAAAVALPGNLYLLRSRAEGVRSFAAAAKGQLAALELQPGAAALQQPVTKAYIEGVEKWGSLAPPATALPASAPEVRAKADETLAALLKPALVTAPAPRRSECAAAEGPEAALPQGGAVLVSETGGGVTLRRFGDAASIDAGTLAPGQPAALVLNPDASPVPWRATVAGASDVRVCTLSEEPIPPSAAPAG